MALDVLTGFCAAFITKKLDSTVSWVGMVRKAVMFIIIGFCLAIDHLARSSHIAQIVAVFFIGYEGLSLIENAGRCGVPLPPALGEALVKLKDISRYSNAENAPTIITEQHIIIDRSPANTEEKKAMHVPEHTGETPPNDRSSITTVGNSGSGQP
jgi:toxin secretion/phage lysis holin